MLDTLTSERADTVRAAVKRVALTQLEAGGPSAVALNAIARELGVSGPALYRYFKNRDALMTALVKDAYDDLAEALANAPESLAHAYRRWALAQPHRYRLLFSAPFPGYDAHQPALVAAAQRSMALLLQIEPDETRAVTLWSRMHGHVSLEIEGNFASMGLDPEALYAATLSA
jgi:AcrR family transcriptional regulator